MHSNRTTTALLVGLHDPADEAVWSEFHRRYRPIVTGFAQRLGLDTNDAEDVAQEALLRFLRRYRAGDYDPERGRLRSWLIGITRNCVAQNVERLARRREWRGESGFAELHGEDELAGLWDEECRRSILRRAMQELRSTTGLAESSITYFERLVFDQLPPAAVAEAHGVSIDAVHKAKQRCMQRVKEIVLRLNAEYEV